MAKEKQSQEELASSALTSFGEETAKALKLYDNSVPREDRLGTEGRDDLTARFIDMLRHRVQQRKLTSRARLRHLLAGAGKALQDQTDGSPVSTSDTRPADMQTHAKEPRKGGHNGRAA